MITYNEKFSYYIFWNLVFSKDDLPKIWDKMRERCINIFNKVFKLNEALKDKQKGGNIDYIVNQMTDYDELINNDKR